MHMINIFNTSLLSPYQQSMLRQNEEKKMTTEKPELCCTCGDWHPFKDDLLEGICKNTNCNSPFDGECDSWSDCNSKNAYGASELGYD